MRFAGWWTKLTRVGPVDIHRVACSACKATHSLWPDVLVARRADLAEWIGAALAAAADGLGHRRVAARLGLPAATVRGGPLRVLVDAAHTAAAALQRLSGEPCPPWRLAVVVAGGRLLG